MRQKTSASPVQPRRSSRCGQSVGMLMKLLRWPQMATLYIFDTISSLVASLPMMSPAELIASPAMASSGAAPPG